MAHPSWHRHQMGTFSALLALCAGNSPVTGEFPSQRPVPRGFVVLFDLRLNKWLIKQSIRRYFETPSRPLWRHCNVQASWNFYYKHFEEQQKRYYESALWFDSRFYWQINPLGPVRCGCKFESVIFKHISRIAMLSTSFDHHVMISQHWFSWTDVDQGIYGHNGVVWRHYATMCLYRLCRPDVLNSARSALLVRTCLKSWWS